mmetsp:Transcript_4850/g.14919  ORF Transcript_4850/g.14919 Transcript_4850/m.14919 type:complete len:353 (-) Transcript_4850:330-1388(-)
MPLGAIPLLTPDATPSPQRVMGDVLRRVVTSTVKEDVQADSYSSQDMTLETALIAIQDMYSLFMNLTDKVEEGEAIIAQAMKQTAFLMTTAAQGAAVVKASPLKDAKAERIALLEHLVDKLACGDLPIVYNNETFGAIIEDFLTKTDDGEVILATLRQHKPEGLSDARFIKAITKDMKLEFSTYLSDLRCVWLPYIVGGQGELELQHTIETIVTKAVSSYKSFRKFKVDTAAAAKEKVAGKSAGGRKRKNPEPQWKNDFATNGRNKINRLKFFRFKVSARWVIFCRLSLALHVFDEPPLPLLSLSQRCRDAYDHSCWYARTRRLLAAAAQYKLLRYRQLEGTQSPRGSNLPR